MANHTTELFLMDKIRAAFIFKHEPIGVCIFGEGKCIISICDHYDSKMFLGCKEEFWSDVLAGLSNEERGIQFGDVKEYGLDEFNNQIKFGSFKDKIKEYVNVTLPQEEL